MPIPPEVVFDRYLRTELSPSERRFYMGRLDLDKVSPLGPRERLISIREGFQEALLDLRERPAWVPHPPVHFDYIEATVPNAVAFCAEGHSFVGITLPLVVELLQTSVLLSLSEHVGALLAAIPEPNKCQRIIELCHSIQLSFVFAHEYTHIIHGHVLPSAPHSMFADEIGGHSDGNLELQAQEVDADGYGTFLVVNDLLNGPRRQQMVELLGLGGRAENFKEAQTELEDLTIFAAFVLSVGAYFYLRLPVPLDDVSVYNLTHPPQAVRMNYVMHVATTLAKHNRDHIASRMTLDRFQMFMGVIATAIHGPTGLGNWDAQNAFLLSERGMRYAARLDERFKRLPSPG